MRLLLRDPHLSPAVQSISVRVLISVTLSLSYLPPAILSPDPALYHGVLTKLQCVSTELVVGTSSTLSKSLPLITRALICADGNSVCTSTSYAKVWADVHKGIPATTRPTPTPETAPSYNSYAPRGKPFTRF